MKQRYSVQREYVCLVHHVGVNFGHFEPPLVKDENNTRAARRAAKSGVNAVWHDIDRYKFFLN